MPMPSNLLVSRAPTELQSFPLDSLVVPGTHQGVMFPFLLCHRTRVFETSIRNLYFLDRSEQGAEAMLAQ
jgi:hypothetical protein